jgi:hypothetical protein
MASTINSRGHRASSQTFLDNHPQDRGILRSEELNLFAHAYQAQFSKIQAILLAAEDVIGRQIIVICVIIVCRYIGGAAHIGKYI